MYPAYQIDDCSDDNLKFVVQTGVNHIVHATHKPFMIEGKGYWSKDALVEFKEHLESYGISIEVMAPPLHANFIEDADNPSIMLGKDGRDKEIDDVIECVKAGGEVGIGSLA